MATTTRLPSPGGDDNQWGDILNDFLSVEHNADGTLKIRTDGTLTAKASDSAVVHNTGDETIAGVKTFSSSPIVPTPTTSTQAANKAYVDSVGGGSGSSTLAGDSDVVISSPSDGQVLTYSSGKWENQAPAAGSTADQMGVCIYSGSAYPARPSGYGSVEFIGPVDPGAAAQANDTWVNTAS